MSFRESRRSEQTVFQARSARNTGPRIPASKTQTMPSKFQTGGFGIGLVIGLLLALAVALIAALVITKSPAPFVDKVANGAGQGQALPMGDPNASLSSAVKPETPAATPEGQAAAAVEENTAEGTEPAISTDQVLQALRPPATGLEDEPDNAGDTVVAALTPPPAPIAKPAQTIPAPVAPRKPVATPEAPVVQQPAPVRPPVAIPPVKPPAPKPPEVKPEKPVEPKLPPSKPAVKPAEVKPQPPATPAEPKPTVPRPAPVEKADPPSRNPAAILEGRSDPKPQAEQPAPAKKVYVQAGAYSSQDQAERQRAVLTLQGYNVQIQAREINGSTIYRVRLGPFRQRAQAEVAQAELQALNLPSIVVGQ